MENKHNILVIGLADMGKTHFGAQLYSKLKEQKSSFKLRTTPSNVEIFEDALNCLNEGRIGNRTTRNQHEAIVLPTISATGKAIDLVYPDYAGEEISDMINAREVKAIWRTQIQVSDAWFLLIRLDMVEDIQDVTTKRICYFTEKPPEPPEQLLANLPTNSAVFYVELLQTLLSVKQISMFSPQKPRLVVLLSCWDIYKETKPDDTKPIEAFQETLPMLSHFIYANWAKDNIHILGLSAVGKDLQKEKSDQEYALEGPENFCYFITEAGNKEKDITKILHYVL